MPGRRRDRNSLDAKIGPWMQLYYCVGLDILGALTYLVPGAGEFVDVAYAPLQAMLCWWLCGGESWGPAYTAFSFTEEILPWTDIIPSMTIAWYIRYRKELF